MRRLGKLGAAAVGIAALLSLPVLAVLASLFAGAGDAWQHIATTLLPGVIARFNAGRPSVAVEILAGPYGAIERMVADREADMGFVRLPPEEPGFQILPLIRSRMVCAVPAGHRLAGQTPIALADLAGADLVLIGRSRGPGRELDKRLRGMRPRARCVIEAHSVETACALVAAGLGVSVVPAHIGNLCADRGVELRPFADAGWNEYGVISRLRPLSAATTTPRSSPLPARS